ncbi:MAG: ATP-binding protein, partial [Nitrospirales bacterium]
VWADRSPAWIPDVLTDGNFPRIQQAADCGLHGAFGFPILGGDEVLGVVEFFSREVREPEPALLAMVTAIGAQIGQFIERRRAETALRESEERFRQLAENIPQVFWMTTPARDQVLYVSPSYEAIWGRSCESLYRSPRTWLEGVYPEDRDRVLASAETKQVSGEYQEEYRIVRPDGGIRWIRDRAFPVRDADGRIGCIVGIAEDVTERRRLEEELRQSQKMDAVGKLAGGIAHDFNNLLTVIIGYCELLALQSDPAGPIGAQVEQIRKAAERAARLTSHLLAFSRKQMLQPKVLDLNEVLSRFEPLLRSMVGEQVELATVPESPLWWIKADPAQLEQVVLNLVSNARDAMPGGGRVVLETGNLEVDRPLAIRTGTVPPGAYVRLVVRDTGHGMDEATLARIFEPFFTTKEVGKGVGLGLSMVYGVVAQSGGYLDIESKPGEGSAFTLYFPRVEAPAAFEAPASVVTPLPRGSETILLVDDEPLVRSVTKNILQKQGYTILEAPNGGEALLTATLRSEPIHLLLADVVMPGMSGPQLAQSLRNSRPALKVLYMSGYTKEALARQGLLEPGASLILKPFSSDFLVRQVREMLDGKRSRADLPGDRRSGERRTGSNRRRSG